MTTRKVTTKGSTKGKAEGSKGKERARDRARAIVADTKGFDKETRDAIRRALENGDAYIAELVRRAEAGEPIHIAGVKPAAGEDDTAAGTPDTAALDYARRAYDAALAHFYAHEGNPFALSRLAVVYDEQQPGDFNMVVTLPGVMRDQAIGDDDMRKVIKDAERIARTLEDPGCSEAYRKAFVSIYTDHLLNIGMVNWEHPAAVRFMIPLIMLDLWRNRPADADTALEILSITLRDALNSDEVCERTRAANG